MGGDVLWAGLLIASLVLLGIDVWGAARARALGGNASAGGSLAQFEAALPRVEDVGQEGFFVALSQQLSARFAHGYGRFTIWSNWLFWALSPVVSRFRSIENTDHLFRYSRQALCAQMAQALVDIASRRGETARVVGLGGHVVAEAFYDDRWHAFDPDYGVVPRYEGEILSVQQLVASPQLAAAVYREHRLPKDSEEVLRVYRLENIVAAGAGEHLSPRTARWQRRLHPLKWLLPVAGVLLAGVAGFCL